MLADQAPQADAIVLLGGALSGARPPERPVLPATTDVEGLPDTLHPLGRWLPDANSLWLSTRALKEYLGLAVLRLRGQ